MNNFYKSKPWKHKRNIILRKANYLCEECKRYGKTEEATTVHHKIPLKENYSKRLENKNLIALCDNCHNQMHDRITNELTLKGKQLRERTYPPIS